jgi:hypothetical protein
MHALTGYHQSDHHQQHEGKLTQYHANTAIATLTNNDQDTQLTFTNKSVSLRSINTLTITAK